MERSDCLLLRARAARRCLCRLAISLRKPNRCANVEGIMGRLLALRCDHAQHEKVLDAMGHQALAATEIRVVRHAL